MMKWKGDDAVLRLREEKKEWHFIDAQPSSSIAPGPFSWRKTLRHRDHLGEKVQVHWTLPWLAQTCGSLTLVADVFATMYQLIGRVNASYRVVRVLSLSVRYCGN